MCARPRHAAFKRPISGKRRSGKELKTGGKGGPFLGVAGTHASVGIVSGNDHEGGGLPQEGDSLGQYVV